MKKYLIIFLLLESIRVLSQNTGGTYEKNIFISVSYGIQISGYKSEDFIGSNVTPSFFLKTGVRFTPELALQLSYNGFYFHTISDRDKHHYHYFFGEVLLNLTKLLLNDDTQKINWSVLLHPGAGLFYNKYYERPNICGIIGLVNSMEITKRIDFFLDVSTIIGWDIYQGDEDILPSAALGVTYSLY